MGLKRFFFIVYLLFQFTSQAQDQPDSLASTLLWKIEGEQSKVSYLFGTIHLIEKEYFSFPKLLEKKLLKCEQVVLELSEIPAEDQVQKLLQLDSGYFRDFFTQVQYDSLIDWSKKNWGMSPTLFNRTFEKLPPFAFSQMTTQMKYLSNAISYDRYIMEFAQKNKLKIGGLESIETQVQLLKNIPRELQTQMAMESIRNVAKNDSLFKLMQTYYMAQDIQALNELIHDKDANLDGFTEDLLDHRNEAWIPKMQLEMAQASTFFAVGAGHLSGKNGLIQLLKNKGYRVTPIFLK